MTTLVVSASLIQDPAWAVKTVDQALYAASASSLIQDSTPVVDDLSTRNSTTTVLGGDQYSMSSSSGPLNYRQAPGSWAPSDSAFIAAAGDTYAVTNLSGPYQAKLPTDAGEAPIRFSAAGQWVTMQLKGLDGTPVVDDNVATYKQVGGASHVTYTALGGGLKEDIFLSSPPANQVAFTYELTLPDGVTPRLQDDGSVGFFDGDGSTGIFIPAGQMTDAASATAPVGSVAYLLDRSSDDGWTLMVVPNTTWLQSPDRNYPIDIDPTLALTAYPTNDCWVREAAPNQNACSGSYVKAGRDSATARYFGLLNFSTGSIPSNATITGASITLYLDSSATTNPSVSTDYAFFTPGKGWDSSATWNSSGANGSWSGGDPGSTAYGALTLSGSNSGAKVFAGNLQSLIQGWVNGTITKRGLLLKQSGGAVNSVLSFYSSTNSDVAKRPKLTVSYTTPNSPPSSATNVITLDGEPLSAIASDPDGDAITETFEIWAGSSKLWTGSISGPSGGRFSVTPPNGLMTDGNRYSIKITGQDASGASSPTVTSSLNVNPDAVLLKDIAALSAAAFSNDKNVMDSGSAAQASSKDAVANSLRGTGTPETESSSYASDSDAVVSAHESEVPAADRSSEISDGFALSNVNISPDVSAVSRDSGSTASATVYVNEDQTLADATSGNGKMYVDANGNMSPISDPQTGQDDSQASWTDTYNLSFSVVPSYVTTTSGQSRLAALVPKLSSVQLQSDQSYSDEGPYPEDAPASLPASSVSSVGRPSEQSVHLPPAGYSQVVDVVAFKLHALAFTKTGTRDNDSPMDSAYPVYKNNCANFTSQSYDQGGIPRTSSWATSPWDSGAWDYDIPGPFGATHTWSVASDLHDFMLNVVKLVPLDNIWNAVPGDTYFMDWNGDGSINHVAMVTGRNRKGTPQITQKTPRRHNMPLNVWIRRIQADPHTANPVWYGLNTYVPNP